MNENYDRSFFEDQAAGSLQSARTVLGKLFPMVQPRRVLDVGCGVGSWLRASLELTADDVIGVDGDYVDRAALMVPPDAFLPADLAKQRLRDVLAERAGAPFDLVICMEVAEHLPYARAATLVEDLTACGDVVLFSAAVPFQYGRNHVNEQWPEFWAILFRSRDFDCFDCLRDDLWADSNVDWWYAQNALIFARKGSAAAARLPQGPRVTGRGLARVHPENLLANLLGLPRRHRHAASGEEFSDLRALVDANLRNAATLPRLAALARAETAGPEARDVFPWTRLDVAQPEQEIAQLVEQVAGLVSALSTETARRRGAEDMGEEEAKLRRTAESVGKEEAKLRGQAQERARYHSSLALAAEQRLRAEVAKRLEAEEGLAAVMAQQRSAADAKRAGNEALYADLAEREAAQTTLAEVRQELGATVAQLAVLRASTVWRATWPLRVIGRRMPGSMRHAMRGSARFAWHTLRRSAPPATVVEREPALPLPSPAAEDLSQSEAEAAAAPEKSELKCYDRVLGTVNWWTLAGAATRLRRFELFDAGDYLRRNPDVAAAGVDPYSHFIQSGAFEERGRIDPEHLARVMSGYMLLDHAKRALVPDAEDASKLAELVSDTGRIGVYVSSNGNVFMEEIAEDLAADLRSVGVVVDVLDEHASIDDRPPICIYVAPHEFFILGRGQEWVRDDVFASGFMLATEQVQTSWFNKALPITLLSRGVLDICSQTADLFARTGMASLHLLPGIRMRPHGLTDQEKQHPLFRVLPAAAQRDPDPRSSLADRPIDIAFFGNSSLRRDRFFARNAAFLADYETFNYCRRPGRGPIRSESDDGALTRLARHVSTHAKITLNIHREEFGYFEWHRMVRLGMCSGSVVVSDPCLPHPDFLANEHYFQEKARHIPDMLEWLLKTEDGMREAERVRSNVDSLITNEFETRRTAAHLLRFLAQHRMRPDGTGQG